MKTVLKALRRAHAFFFPDASAFGRNWKMFPVKDHASDLLRELISSGSPGMVARLGSTELSCMVNYIGVKSSGIRPAVTSYVLNKSPCWWWNDSVIRQMKDWSGFFPANVSSVERFSELMINDLTQVDVLGSWLKEESFFQKQLVGAKRVMLEDLEPFFCERPWTHALAGKRVLVVHPFAETIKAQYARRELVFPDGLLPEFSLEVIPAVQSLGGEGGEFKDWFEALDSMKARIDQADFDVCILGCGAYGFPLAAHIKRKGRLAIHLGGATQLLFGIKGRRWENYIVYPYSNLFNEYWVRPGEAERPKSAQAVEGACYW